MNQEDEKHLRSLLRHVDNVRQSSLLLGERIIESGNEKLGIDLISNGQIHDYSKFRGCEWLYLRPEFIDSTKKELFDSAKKQHVNSNPHHPEYWGSIHQMPKVYIAEMVCDWSARSHEQGNDLREWIREKGTKIFDMTTQSKVYREIKFFVDLLLEPSFKNNAK
ncbi:MAG TPA: hypothetical protein DHV30_16495 [Balneola sp.]|nr:hypothetical protein [Balneola sp.]|tara:strand:- start:3804 stop:4295 length:492 start_codon:yes stop_codon:yes gene_type:complete